LEQDVVVHRRGQHRERASGDHVDVFERLRLPPHRAVGEECEVAVAVEPVAVRVDVQELRMKLCLDRGPVALCERERPPLGHGRDWVHCFLTF
jgi:hypothetical protein